MGSNTIQIKLNFFDDYWLDFRPNTTRRWFQPRIKSHYTDDDFLSTYYCSAFYDEMAGKYRLFYEVAPDLQKCCNRYLALAESDDGFHYTPAAVNDNNEMRMRRIVLDGDLSGSSVFLDPYDPDPSRRYKCVSGFLRSGAAAAEDRPILIAYSPDGLHWELQSEPVLHPYVSDTNNGIFYNPLSKEYCLILRGANLDRRIAMRTSKDLENWSDPFIIVHPSPHYNDSQIAMQFYGMGACFIDGVFLGCINWFNTSLTDMDFSKMWGTMDSELLYSYDGRYFMQTSGKPIVDRPPPPAYGCSQLYLFGLMENREKDEYIFYGIGSNILHGPGSYDREMYAKNNGVHDVTVFASIRKDGFCGLEGIGAGACVVTKPLQLLKDDLTFNVNASTGTVRFGLMDVRGNFIHGFSYDDCVPFSGDGVRVTPGWKNAGLGSMLGRQVRVAVELNGALLHSINLTARPCIRAPQIGFHDPMQAGGKAEDCDDKGWE